MNRPLVVSTFGILVLVVWLAAWSIVGSAERSPELLTGELWQTMSPDAKVSFGAAGRLAPPAAPPSAPSWGEAP